jgi:hypothetical protein
MKQVRLRKAHRHAHCKTFLAASEPKRHNLTYPGCCCFFYPGSPSACVRACLLAASTELLKFLFSMLEGADVLLESDNLAQLKQEYNISGSARSPISASGGAAAASARREELWARYPFLQVWVRCALLPLQLCASE